MSNELAFSLAAALGLSPADAEARPEAPPRGRPSVPRNFTSLRLPDRDEDGIGDIREARRAREMRDVSTPSALIRKAVEEWPDQSAQVAALATALGVQRGEAWRRVIVAGIAALSEDVTDV